MRTGPVSFGFRRSWREVCGAVFSAVAGAGLVASGAGCCGSGGPLGDSDKPANLSVFYFEPGRPEARLSFAIEPPSCTKLPSDTTVEMNGQPMTLDSRGGSYSLGGGKSISVRCSEGVFTTKETPTGLLSFRVRSKGKEATLKTTAPVVPLTIRWVNPPAPRPVKIGQSIEFELGGGTDYWVPDIYLDKKPIIPERMTVLKDNYSQEGARLKLTVSEPAEAGKKSETFYVSTQAKVPASVSGARGEVVVKSEIEVQVAITR